MSGISDLTLFILLLIMCAISAFFSGSETAMMAINRYRLRHLVRLKNPAALRVNTLLRRPDRLLGVLLIGNTFGNMLAAAVMTVIAIRHFNDFGVFLADIAIASFILIFSEMAPKTVAAMYPQQFSFFVSIPLTWSLKIIYPLVWLATSVANTFLRLFGVKLSQQKIEHLSAEELRTMLHEAGSRIPSQHQEMLLSILDLEKIRVNDVMVPRHEIELIDLDDDIEKIMKQLTTTQYTQLPLCQDGIDNVRGILHIRGVVNLLAQGKLTRKNLLQAARPAYFVPEGTPLHTQLMNFREAKRRMGLVVDEYGDIQGLVSIEDILEEIVGDLDSSLPQIIKEVQKQTDGSYLIDGSANLRDLNRMLQWSFSVEGPKTLSGLIVEYLEVIPQPGTCVRIDGYPIEIIEIKGNLVKTAKVYPQWRLETKSEDEEESF